MSETINLERAIDEIARLRAALSKAERGVIAEVAAERKRQIENEGWTAEHDNSYTDGELARAAASYAVASLIPILGHARWFNAPLLRDLWPWSEQWWKPTSSRRNLIKAGALIVAEIERLDRASPPPQEAERQSDERGLATD